MTDLYRLPSRSTDLGGSVWPALALILMGLLLTVWIATEYTAWALGWSPALGPPLTRYLYGPFDGLRWRWQWSHVSPALTHVFTQQGLVLQVGALLSVLAGIGLAVRRWPPGHAPNDLHGSAHWATPAEVRATGLLPPRGQPVRGVYVGAWLDPKTNRKKYLTHDGPEHVLAFAPTRSGKGVGLVIPTLLTWPHAVLVHDLKGENWALTAGWRQRELGSRCLKFDPTVNDDSSVRFNPLQEVRLGTVFEIKDVQNIATMIVDPDGKGLMDHWARTGHALLVGAILHVLYAEPDKTLRGVASFLSTPDRTFIETLQVMQETAHRDGVTAWPYGDQAVHPVVLEAAQEMLNKSYNECSGVLSTAMSFLALYRDPLVARATATSDFTLRELREADPPLSLYLVVPPADKDRLKPLLRLILNQVARTLTERLDPPTRQSSRRRLLLLIDEFPALGKLEVFQEALAYFAGYGLKAYLIAQDLTQLQAAYGRDDSIVSNCHVRIASAPNRIETAELLSKMAGSMTVRHTTRTYTGGRLDPALMHLMAAEQDTERRLLTPDEALRLPADDLLIFVAGHAPIDGKKIKYYNDKEFARRARLGAPTTAHRRPPGPTTPIVADRLTPPPVPTAIGPLPIARTEVEADTPCPPAPQTPATGPTPAQKVSPRWRRQTVQATPTEHGRTRALPGTREEAPPPDLEPELTPERPPPSPLPGTPPPPVKPVRRRRSRPPQRERGPDLER
jgi:type IV secretion system protein VirD4